MDASLGRNIRRLLIYGALPATIFLAVGGALWWRPFHLFLIPLVPLTFVGIKDMLQKKRAILRNFPLIGHGRYLMEMIRPELHQYFIETNTNGMPFDRNRRANIYQRAKQQLNTLPFGAQLDMYEPGYEWIDHSIRPRNNHGEPVRVTIGNAACKQPYSASILNISAMSFGSLSPTAVEALNLGAEIGQFAHNTGEGSISPYHLAGGDLIWQIGTGYFGCRNHDGTFNEETYQKRAQLEQVKMIELKLSQGAKPGHGGILPKEKITPVIAEIRDVTMDHDVISPPGHSAFDTPIEMMHFIQKLRDLSGGKPVGFKLCIGDRSEFISLCNAMIETQIYPDFIAIDGGEGGTGAAPIEFSNSIGMPLTDALVFAYNCLVGFDIKQHIKIMAAGKVTSGFDIASRIALGADLCYSARGMMFAIGCIQALTCNSNHCPTGVATQDKNLYQGLDVTDKKRRVANYHRETVESLMEILGSAGLGHPDELRADQINRRIDQLTVKTYDEIYNFLTPGQFLGKDIPANYKKYIDKADRQKNELVEA